MRWAVSFLFFFFAGGFVALEVSTALVLMEQGRGLFEQAAMLQRFVGLAAACFALGFALSPINRWRSLGRALLAGALAGIVGAAPVYALMPNPSLLTWKLGLIILLLIVALGTWLDRRPGEFRLV